MSAITLRERIKSYQDLTDYKFLPKLPVAVVVNGRSFRKITSMLDKPFSDEFIELMGATTIKLMAELDGSVIAFSYNDEIVIILRNDQSAGTQAYYDGKIQAIASASAAIATYEFNRVSRLKDMRLFGDPIFIANAFVVPNIVEAINVLIAKQNQAYHTSLNNACFHNLAKKYNLETVRQTLSDKSTAAKIDLLLEECGINFDNFGLPIRRGFAVYRVQKLVQTAHEEVLKNKLQIDLELPNFSQNPEFLTNIVKNNLFRLEK